MNMFWFLHKEMQAIVIGFAFRQLSQQDIREPIEKPFICYQFFRVSSHRNILKKSGRQLNHAN